MSAEKVVKKEKSKDKEKKVTDVEQGHVAIEVAKKILRTTWGMRAGLGLLGVLLFFIGYVIGNWGTAELKAEINNKKAEINDLLQAKKSLTEAKLKLHSLVTDLKIKLSDSNSKMRFLKQRQKIRGPLYEALKFWKIKDKTATEEKLYAALINLKSESRGAMGISRWFYETAVTRLTVAIKNIKSGCPHSKDAKSTPEEHEKSCHQQILDTIIQATEVLPAPKE